MLKRTIDIFCSLIGLIILFPLLVVLAILVAIDSPGGAFYRQERIGQFGKKFLLYKFRTMRPFSDQQGLLTVGGKDPRVTDVGFVLRRYKFDELPQLLNVLKGDMSLVGPRPEVAKYVELYSDEQKKVLGVKPGITDYASLEYFDENELLSQSQQPEQTYINEVMPAKLILNLKYIKEANLSTDFKIIFKTLKRIVS